ncbi:glycosyl hydrolase, family 43 [Verrucomicrobiia bacterium DG1235]|nr:glycosyl hydrolase, family 43 [Verrucomicrobiae bacterium DG1235]
MKTRSTLRRFLCALGAIAFGSLGAIATDGDDESLYLFSYFEDNGQDGLRLAWSQDGLKWHKLNDGQSFLHPQVGESKLMRDPCLARGPDGVYHMVWTDSWHSKTIGYASTRDFVTWSEQKEIPVMAHESTAVNCWAPEIVYDAEGEQFLIFWATTLPEKFTETWYEGENHNNHRIYSTTTKDFQDFTPTKLFFEPGFNCIDSTLLIENDQVYMFFKDESNYPSPMKNLRLAIAENVEGPYTVVEDYITPPDSWVEGPTSVRIGDYVYLYFDAYSDGNYGVLRSKNLKEWVNVSSELSMPDGIRHGTAFSVEKEIVDALLARDGKELGSLSGEASGSGNPLLPGYFGDPSVVELDGTYYLYATLDPWGGETLGCWESENLKDWTYRVLNWPTKEACSSPTSNANRVWAPSVVSGPDGLFHMIVSVGSEMWAGVAEHPLGPWRDANQGKPLVPGDYRPGYHMIDGEYFIDDDGKAFLYWGSGLNWENGRCWAVELEADLVTFAGEVQDVTPPHFFEAPFMLKHNGDYYLMYSEGKTTDDTYKVHYAIGESPLGPFHLASNSPILVSDESKNILGPGHHTVVENEGQHYVLYHRHSIPFRDNPMLRQICVDELNFDEDGLIEAVVPTHGESDFGLSSAVRELAGLPARASASGSRFPSASPDSVLDDNFATRWQAPDSSDEAWLQLDLGEVVSIKKQILLPEYAWVAMSFKIEYSLDGEDWAVLIDHIKHPVSGSPLVFESDVRTRLLRIVFPEVQEESKIGIFEWKVF